MGESAWRVSIQVAIDAARLGQRNFLLSKSVCGKYNGSNSLSIERGRARRTCGFSLDGRHSFGFRMRKKRSGGRDVETKK